MVPCDPQFHNHRKNAVNTTTAPHGRRVAIASLVGTALESYDQYVFAWLAALFVGPLFFEPLGVVGGTLAAFATYGVTFVVRPLGGIIFGYIGDHYGRRITLITTVTMIGLATGLVGLLPTYAQGGWTGAIILVALRLVEGLSLGGEWGGAVTMSAEHATSSRRGFAATLPQLGSPIGSILSNAVWLAVFILVPYDQIGEWAWRIPLLTALPLLLVSLYLRWGLPESPEFLAMKENSGRTRIPLGTVLRHAPVAFIVAIGAALLGHGSYTVMNTYTLNYGAYTLGYDYMQMTMALTIGGIVQLIAIPLFGVWANRIGSARVVAWGALGTVLAAFPMYWLIQDGSMALLIGIMIIGGILPTAAWAGLGGTMDSLFDARVRMTALALAYNVAAAIAATLPFILTFTATTTANAWWHPAVVLVGLSLITLVSALFAHRIARRTV